MTDSTIQRTIDQLQDCHRACQRQISMSLDLGGPHASVRHIDTLTDLSDLAHVTAELLDGESDWEWAEWLCELTADACTDAAARCDALGESECARTCRATALACAALGWSSAWAG